MKRTTTTICAALALFFFTIPAWGVWGVADQVPAASILVPFFEVGVDASLNPHDTLVTIYNRSGSALLHWEVRDIDGALVLSGNVGPFGSAATWPVSLRDLINTNASPGERDALTVGDFYRGFMTIDRVTEETLLSPFEAGYPFSPQNTLVGAIYYVRLLQGSANGIAAVHLEHTNGAPVLLEGFYDNNDDREEVDVRARDCAQNLIAGLECNSTATDSVIEAIRMRTFRNAALNGDTRYVIFTWNTERNDEGGPSAICDDLGTCPSEYPYTRFNELGENVESYMLRLDHVVNVITPAGETSPGELLINDLEDPNSNMQIFAFSFNSASPAGNSAINWDAIFEANIQVN